MKGISKLSVMDLTCSEADLERGPKIPTTPFSEIKWYKTPFLFRDKSFFLTQEVTGFPFGNEGVVRRNVHCLCVKLDPGQQISEVGQSL